MNAYHFEGTDFALAETGIHLLRSGYSYRFIEYGQIQKATIKRAAEIDNVLIALAIGTILIAFAFLQTVNLIQLFNDPEVHRIHIEAIVLPLLPGLVGLYLVFMAIRKGPVLIIESGNKKKKLRLREFRRRNETGQIKNYLREKLSHKFFIHDEV